MYKVTVPDAYPPEEGCYLRGNDNSPVAVVVILKDHREKTPPSIEKLVRVALESGAALAGTLQTENVGFEKVICNVIANPNIRYVIVCGPESPGHFTGEAIASLYENGIDANKRIPGTKSPAPFLYNIPTEWVERFRQQTTLINLLNEGDPELIRTAVWSCYQEEPTKFRHYSLRDPGAFKAESICGQITWNITNPYSAPKTDEEKLAVKKMHNLMEQLRKRTEAKQQEKKS